MKKQAKSTCCFTIRSLLLLLLLCSAVFFCPQYVLPPFSSVLVVDQEAVQADAVVVLLGSSQADRILKAYEIYKKGLAPIIAYGSGFVDKEIESRHPEGLIWLDNSQIYTRALNSLGVPDKDIAIIPSERAYDTAGELKAVYEYAKTAGWKTVILVTTASHTRRVDLIWKRVAAGISHRVAAAPQPELKEWWKHGRMRREVAYHYASLLKEFASTLKQWGEEIKKQISSSD